MCKCNKFVFSVNLADISWEYVMFIVEDCTISDVHEDELSAAFFDTNGDVVGLQMLNGFTVDNTHDVVLTNSDVVSVVSDACLLADHVDDITVDDSVIVVLNNHLDSPGYVLLHGDDRLTAFADIFIEDFVSRMQAMYPEFHREDDFMVFYFMSSICGRANFNKLLFLINNLYSYVPCSSSDFVFNSVDYLPVFLKRFPLVELCGVIFRIPLHLKYYLDSYPRYRAPKGRPWTHFSLALQLLHFHDLYMQGFRVFGGVIQESLRKCGIHAVQLHNRYSVDNTCSMLVGKHREGELVDDFRRHLSVFERRVCSFVDGVRYSSLPVNLSIKLKAFIYSAFYSGIFPSDVIARIVDVVLRADGHVEYRLMTFDQKDRRYNPVRIDDCPRFDG